MRSEPIATISNNQESGQAARFDWVDVAKGFCIILVVMLHVTGGIEAAIGERSWLAPFIEWAKLFRMPTFFLLSGLFFSRFQRLSWPAFLDRKIALLAYFYLLWLVIQCAVRFPVWGREGWSAPLRNIAIGLVEPFGTLWFIYLLAVFFLVTRFAWRYPLPSWLVAAMLAAASPETGWLVPDAFAGYYVYFLTGALLAPRIMALVDRVEHYRVAALGLCLAWAAATAALTGAVGVQAIAEIPAALPVLGFAGAGGVMLFSALAGGRLGWIAYCGRNSLPIYLAFFVPMVAGRILLLEAGVPVEPGLAALAVTASAVALPLALQRMVKGSVLGFLFERPAALRFTRAAEEKRRAAEQLDGLRRVNAPAGR